MSTSWKSPRLQACGLHLVICMLLASAMAALVFWLWYPSFYSTLTDVKRIFGLIIGIDVIIGPLLTLVIFNPRKPRKELWRDLTIIALLQISALIYGIYSIYLARPIGLVYEQDRFRVIAATDVYLQELSEAPLALRALPQLGPRLMGTRHSKSNEEFINAIELAIRGFDLAQRPSYWVDYAQVRDEALKHAQAAETILKKSTQRDRILADLKDQHLDPAQVRVLPLQAKVGPEKNRNYWLVFIDQTTGLPVGVSEHGQDFQKK